MYPWKLCASMALMTLLTISCTKELDNPQDNPGNSDKEMEEITPITISAKYANIGETKVQYVENENDIYALWEEGDQLYVIYNGHVNTLSLSDGAGTASATFSGSITGKPTASSVLSCYVRDVNNTAAFTINAEGDLIYTDEAFLSQDGTMAGSAKCNTYSGTTNYGNGQDITCSFSVNVSMLMFTTFAPVDESSDATLTYMSGESELAKAHFSVGLNGNNLVYLAVPAGHFTGEQSLVYKTSTYEQSYILSATKANFKAGQVYCKSMRFPIDLSVLHSDFTAQDGDVLTGTLNGNYQVTVANNASVILKDAIIDNSNNSKPGIICAGNATLLLNGESTVKGGNRQAGIRIGGTGTTLTIDGSGAITVIGGNWAGGIGLGAAWYENLNGGNIVINGGNITAKGDNDWSAAIGTGTVSTGNTATMGTITINGGTITANGGKEAAGIGTSFAYGDATNHVESIQINGGTISATGGIRAAAIGTGMGLSSSAHNTVGSISISAGVTSVIAIKGEDASSSIGAGKNGSCGTVTIVDPSKITQE